MFCDVYVLELISFETITFSDAMSSDISVVLCSGFPIRIDLMRIQDTDPDPAFFLIADPDSGSGSRIRIQGLMI